jgi:tRNA threonylcarbamoyladenosine biosynthesis protein TsaE
MKEFILDSPGATDRFGQIIGTLCKAGDVICLKGDLGSGKTTLTKAIAIGLGVDTKEYVTSPTFAVCHQYNGTLNLYHMDFYRLAGSSDVIDMGLEEYFYLSGVTVIEWYEVAGEIVPADNLKIELTVVDETKRKALLKTDSRRWEKLFPLVQELFQTAFH